MGLNIEEIIKNNPFFAGNRSMGPSPWGPMGAGLDASRQAATTQIEAMKVAQAPKPPAGNRNSTQISQPVQLGNPPSGWGGAPKAKQSYQQYADLLPKAPAAATAPATTGLGSLPTNSGPAEPNSPARQSKWAMSGQ